MRSREGKRSVVYGKAKRFLSKARDFYVKSLMDFDGRFGGQASQFMIPTTTSSFGGSNFMVKKKIRKDDDEDENMKEFYYRSMSMKNFVYTEEKEGFKFNGSRRLMMDRSYSVGVGRIGRIDEEEPCEFLEEEISMKSEILFPRTRSCAVSKQRSTSSMPN